MATEKWIAGSGVGYTWTTCFVTANLTSLANNVSMLSSSADITNQTSQDIFCDFSINFASVVIAAPAYIGVYLYPLNSDGTTYGDKVLVAGTASAASIFPSATYFKGSIICPVGTFTPVGTLTGIVMPPGSFRFAIYQGLGVALSASTNACNYRTYNRQVV